MSEFRTDQEAFWAGSFGANYISRNSSDELLASNLAFFVKALSQAGRIGSCIELGANVGMNLRALSLLYPGIGRKAVEINPSAAAILGEVIGTDNVFCGSILDYELPERSDLVLSKGVLIHINPEVLPQVYEKLYQASARFILIAEYYNPAPVVISYRGHQDRLFKRDFAGEILDLYDDLRILDYGFAYRRDPAFPQDDISWFLLEKQV